MDDEKPLSPIDAYHISMVNASYFNVDMFDRLCDNERQRMHTQPVNNN